MSRVKKDGVFFNCYMKQGVFDDLSAYAAKTDMSKTAIVEKAVRQYISDNDSVSDDSAVSALLSKFNKGNYVYPSVLVRNLHISYSDAIAILDNVESLEKVKYCRCPMCLHSDFSTATAFDEPIADLQSCSNCGEEFHADINRNIDIAYRVK